MARERGERERETCGHKPFALHAPQLQPAYQQPSRVDLIACVELPGFVPAGVPMGAASEKRDQLLRC